MENKVLEAMSAGISYYNHYQHAPNELQMQAKQLCWEYNQSRPDEMEKRKKILQELFGSCNELVMVEPIFHCDYGFNIHFHGMALINYNVTILDTANVSIGANCTICGGVTIGKGSVIGAGSVVTKDIPAGVVSVGTPCKVMRKITEKDKIDIKKIL